MLADDDPGIRRAAVAHVFVPAGLIDVDGRLPLDDETTHHLDRVLRVRDGESVTVTDGAGRWRSTRVRRAGSGVELEPAGAVVAEVRGTEQLTLATAMPKGDRLEWLVQKTTELGVDRLVLLHCDRSVTRWKDERADRQRERLQRIADEACRQSRRVWRIAIEGPVVATSILPTAVVAEPGGRNLTPTDRHVAVGPEGGWTAEELAVAADRVDLGENVLRTETAAIAVAALAAAARRG